MATCNRCHDTITWKLSKKGKWYTVNQDDSFHSSTCTGVRIENSQVQKSESLDQPNFSKADHLLEKQKVNDAKTYVEQLSNRLTKYELKLVVIAKDSRE